MANKAKIALVVLAGLATGLFAVWRFASDRRSAEQRILDSIVDIQRAVEAKSVRGCMKYISEDYEDSINKSKRQLTQLVMQGFRERGHFTCDVKAGRPVVEGDRAAVDAQVDFAINYGDHTNREGPFSVHTEWVREGRTWRILRAEGYLKARDAYEF